MRGVAAILGGLVLIVAGSARADQRLLLAGHEIVVIEDGTGGATLAADGAIWHPDGDIESRIYPEDTTVWPSEAIAIPRGSAEQMGGTHSCESGTPMQYDVITLRPTLATDGPLTACAELVASATNGMIVLEEDPMRANKEGGGEAWTWGPGEGFKR